MQAMSATRASAASLEVSKAMAKELLAMEPGKPGGIDWEQSRKLFRLGLVRPVKPSESWIPAVMTDLGVEVRDLLASKKPPKQETMRFKL